MGPEVPDLHDDVVRLRLPTEQDLDALTAACQDPEIPKFTRVPSPYTRDNAAIFLSKVQAAWSDPDGAEELSFLIVDRSSDALLGAIGLKQFRDRATAEVGYWLAADARGHGHVSRAVRLVAPWALRDLGFSRLELLTHVHNVASQAVAERAGFTREGIVPSQISTGCCEDTDVVMFALLPADL